MANSLDAATNMEESLGSAPDGIGASERVQNSAPSAASEQVRPLFPPGFKLSVVIPAYNEFRWIKEVLRRVNAVPVPMEIIVVDDFSTDGTREILGDLVSDKLRVVLMPENRGKGAALRAGFAHATGDVILVQDADLEYDPSDYPELLRPILENEADVVFGSRFINGRPATTKAWHRLGNGVLTWLSNFFTGLPLTDMETCYKVFRRDVLEGVTLRSDRFGFEPEFTAKIAKRRPAWRVVEKPVRYSPRSYSEGKKIGVRDGFQAIYCILRYWLAD